MNKDVNESCNLKIIKIDLNSKDISSAYNEVHW